MLKRYSADAKADRAALDAAYADAMLAAAAAQPAEDDLALLAAEAAMDTRPWDYWTVDKEPNPRIGEAVRLVETVYGRGYCLRFEEEPPEGAPAARHPEWSA